MGRTYYTVFDVEGGVTSVVRTYVGQFVDDRPNTGFARFFGKIVSQFASKLVVYCMLFGITQFASKYVLYVRMLFRRRV